jgi:hypothetical protein
LGTWGGETGRQLRVVFAVDAGLEVGALPDGRIEISTTGGATMGSGTIQAAGAVTGVVTARELPTFSVTGLPGAETEQLLILDPDVVTSGRLRLKPPTGTTITSISAYNPSTGATNAMTILSTGVAFTNTIRDWGGDGGYGVRVTFTVDPGIAPGQVLADGKVEIASNTGGTTGTGTIYASGPVVVEVACFDGPTVTVTITPRVVRDDQP